MYKPIAEGVVHSGLGRPRKKGPPNVVNPVGGQKLQVLTDPGEIAAREAKRLASRKASDLKYENGQIMKRAAAKIILLTAQNKLLEKNTQTVFNGALFCNNDNVSTDGGHVQFDLPPPALCLEYLAETAKCSYEENILNCKRGCEDAQVSYAMVKVCQSMHIQKRRKPETFVKSLISTLTTMITNIDGGSIVSTLHKKHDAYYKNECFSALNLCKAQDLSASACFNGQALNLVRGLIPAQKGAAVIVPHRSSVERFCRDLERGAETVIGGTLFEEGNAAVLDHNMVMNEFITRLELEALAGTDIPIQMVATIDGLKLTAHQGIVAFGLKITDAQYKNFGTNDSKIDIGIQSQNNSVICGVFMGKDSKNSYER